VFGVILAEFWLFAFGVILKFEKMAFGEPSENFGLQPWPEFA